MKKHLRQKKNKENNGERSSVGLLQGQDDYEKLETADMEDTAFQLGNSVFTLPRFDNTVEKNTKVKGGRKAANQN